jgi:hypothetical protein
MWWVAGVVLILFYVMVAFGVYGFLDAFFSDWQHRFNARAFWYAAFWPITIVRLFL